jgi:hypothetical protein
MKKILLLTLALGLASVSQLMAVDVYITGSTAFRQNVYAACIKMFTAAPTIVYGDKPFGGDGTIGNGNGSWAMIGTAANTLSFSGSPLVIHALFTGSISGIQTVENGVPLVFPVTGVNASLASTYVTNKPTFAFSDSASAASPAYDVNNFGGNFAEEQVAVQPFVICRSLAPSGVVTSITNVTWEQIRSIFPKGRLPYSAWSSKATDTNTYVYLFNRTSDSGSRCTVIEEFQYSYNQNIQVYNFDNIQSVFYRATNSLFATAGTNGFGVIGSSAGNGNANLIWGPGFIGGGDLRTALKYVNAANQSIGYLSMADARTAGLNQSGTQWGSILSFNGVWPTASGASINTTLLTTNDYSPVTLGNYPLWTYEVVIFPTGEPASGGISKANLGDQSTPFTFLGVLDSQTLFNGGSPIVGSLEFEIEASKTIGPAYATAIRLSDMTASRASVGGTIQVTPVP